MFTGVGKFFEAESEFGVNFFLKFFAVNQFQWFSSVLFNANTSVDRPVSDSHPKLGCHCFICFQTVKNLRGLPKGGSAFAVKFK